MSMNYCPNCGRRLEEDTKYCPYCGAYLKEDSEEIIHNDDYSMSYSPEDAGWVKKWNDRARNNKIGIVILFAVMIPVLLIPMIRFSLEVEWMPALWPLIIVEILITALFIYCIVAIIKRKNIVKVIDGYTVLVFITNNQHALVVEDEMQDSQMIHNSRYSHTIPINLHGHLPNGRKIYADFENKVHGTVEIRFED